MVSTSFSKASPTSAENASASGATPSDQPANGFDAASKPASSRSTGHGRVDGDGDHTAVPPLFPNGAGISAAAATNGGSSISTEKAVETTTEETTGHGSAAVVEKETTIPVGSALAENYVNGSEPVDSGVGAGASAGAGAGAADSDRENFPLKTPAKKSLDESGPWAYAQPTSPVREMARTTGTTLVEPSLFWQLRAIFTARKKDLLLLIPVTIYPHSVHFEFTSF